MSNFFQAYRKLNIFLLIFCICPFLQSKRTARFVCRRKYLLLVCVITLIYHTFVTLLSFYHFPPILASIARKTTIIKVLKFCHAVGNVYTLLFVTSLLTVRRKSHANFFNKLYHFDRTYNRNINPPINYAAMNRKYWTEITVSAVYMTIVFITEVQFNEKLGDVVNLGFWSCEVGSQIGHFFVVLHLKNCACNLIVRFRRITYLLKTLHEPSKIMMINKCSIARSEIICQRFEHITHMYDILFMARDHLEKAFGSALLLLFVYNMFTVALSTYIMINASVYEGRNEHTYRHLLYIIIKYFLFELPLTIKDFYFTTYFHFLANQVKNICKQLRTINTSLWTLNCLCGDKIINRLLRSIWF